MAYTLNDKLTKLTAYTPIEGDYRIRLDANESFLPPYDELRDVINLAVSQVELNRYPDPIASRVCEFFGSFYGVDSQYITAGNGSDELISVVVNAFLQKGDKAMVMSPDFSMYSFYIALAEAECIHFQKEEDFTVDVDRLIAQLNETECKLLIFSNPCNPTSIGMKREDVRRIIHSTDALVVLDEAYMDFWDQSMIQEAPEYDNLILLRTCSKMLGMAAIRLGFAVADERLTTLLRAAKSPYNVNSMTQAAGAAVFAHPDLIRSANRKLLESRNELYLLLKDMSLSKKIVVYPTCTNFVFIKLCNANHVFEKLKEHSIIVRRFGDYLRITCGSNYENRMLFEALIRSIDSCTCDRQDAEQ